MEPFLTFRNISKSFAGIRALDGVELDLWAGEIHALLGENGAGKSTLTKIITGILAPEPGAEMIIAGRTIEALSPDISQSLGVQAIYQQPTLFDHLSVMENLRIGRDGALIDWRHRREKTIAWLGQLDIHLDPDKPAGLLRMSEKQLLEIARALSRDARLLILDEPTASLPQKDADLLLDRILDLRRSGVAILYISHRLEEIERIADRLTILRDGRWVGTYRKDDLSRPDIIRHMAGRPLETMYGKKAIPPGVEVLKVEQVGCEEGNVEDISFTLRAGEILGVAGLVGSGRTELARVLFGITPADRGRILVDGHPVRIGSPSEALAAGIAYVPEDRHRHGVILDLPVLDNVTIAVLSRFTRKGLIQRDDEAAEASRLAQQLHIKAPSLFAPVRQLSGGNQQKVALARWLAGAPRVLVLDEPTQGIDIGAKSEIYKLIEQLAEQGMAILMISSDMQEILGMSDRIAVMRWGRMVKIFERGACAADILEHAFDEASPA